MFDWSSTCRPIYRQGRQIKKKKKKKEKKKKRKKKRKKSLKVWNHLTYESFVTAKGSDKTIDVILNYVSWISERRCAGVFQWLCVNVSSEQCVIHDVHVCVK